MVQVSTHTKHSEIHYVQSKEVKGSYHMEKEGLVRAVDFLRKKKFKIASSSDRPLQGNIEMGEGNIPGTDHRYDIWHLAKCKFLSVLLRSLK